MIFTSISADTPCCVCDKQRRCLVSFGGGRYAKDKFSESLFIYRAVSKIKCDCLWLFQRASSSFDRKGRGKKNYPVQSLSALPPTTKPTTKHVQVEYEEIPWREAKAMSFVRYVSIDDPGHQIHLLRSYFVLRIILLQQYAGTK